MRRLRGMVLFRPTSTPLRSDRHGAPARLHLADDTKLLCRRHVGLLALPILQLVCWMARANENANAQGGATRIGRLWNSNEQRPSYWLASSTRTQIPGTAAGTACKETLTVASATSFSSLAGGRSNLGCSPMATLPHLHAGTGHPGSTMLGFRIIPSSITRCV